MFSVAGSGYLDFWFEMGFWIFLGAESLQGGNQIGDAGACSIGEGLKFNASVQILYLVSCGVGVCVERCCG